MTSMNQKPFYPDALDDPRFRAQMQGLKDITAAIDGTVTSPVVFSTDKISDQAKPAAAHQSGVRSF